MKPLTFSQALTGFFLTAQARRLSSHTIADYSQTLDKKFKTFLEKDYLVEQITAQHVESFLAAQTTIKKKTLLNYHTALSAFWTWAVREKIAKEHVVRGVQAPKPEIPDIQPYTEEESRAMLSSLELLMATEPRYCYLTHFGRVAASRKCTDALERQLREYLRLAQASEPGEQRQQRLAAALLDHTVGLLRAAGNSSSAAELRELLAMDMDLNAQGLLVWLERQR